MVADAKVGVSYVSEIRLAYAANRELGAKVLELLCQAKLNPVALLVPDGQRASHVAEMKAMLDRDALVIEGKSFREAAALDQLAAFHLDYVLSVHFPYIFPPEFLRIPKIGTLNLHPALLPYNRGWNTPSWAIIDGSPVGITLHWVDEGIDSGDIVLQRAVEIRPDDTANRLYQRLLLAELELMHEAIPLLRAGRLPRQTQRGDGSFHAKADLKSVRELPLDGRMRVRDVIDRLRGLTTSDRGESAYFVEAGRRYLVRVEITEDTSDHP